MIGRLNHVAIAVPDLAAAAAKYRDQLGAHVHAPQALPEHGVTVLSAKLGYKAKSPVSMGSLSSEQQEEVQAFLAGLDDNDDVQNVYVGLVD